MHATITRIAPSNAQPDVARYEVVVTFDDGATDRFVTHRRQRQGQRLAVVRTGNGSTYYAFAYDDCDAFDVVAERIGPGALADADVDLVDLDFGKV